MHKSQAIRSIPSMIFKPFSTLVLLASAVAPSAFAQNVQVLNTLNGFANNDTQREVNRAVAILCPAGNRLSERLQADCNALVGNAFRGNANVRTALARLTADNAPLSANRAFAPIASSLPLSAFSQFSKTGAGPDGLMPGTWSWASDNSGSSWGLFATFDSRSQERDASPNVDGFDGDSQGALLGIEYALSESSRLGAAVRYRRGDVDFSSGSGKQDTRDVGGDVFFNTQGQSPWYFNALMSFGSRDTDQTRLTNYSLDATTTVAQSYLANFDTSLQNFSATVGYNWGADALSFDPYLQVEHRRQSVDGYSEQASTPTANGAGWAIRAEEQDQSSTSATLGARLSYANSTGNGVFVPFLDVGLVNVFNQDDENARLSFVGDTSTVREGFSAFNDEEDDFFGVASIGISAQFAGSSSGFIRYSQYFSEDRFEQRSFHLGWRWDF